MSDPFLTMPCLIGYSNLRIQSDGEVFACCSSPFPMGNINQQSLDEIWHSHSYYSWREKFFNIHKTHFHHREHEFAFCKMCPHLIPNFPLNRALSLERK